MANEDQAQADLQSTETPVADHTDAANSTDSGTMNAMDAYEAEVQAALNQGESSEQGEQPASEEAEESQEHADDSGEAEEQEQISEVEPEEEEEPEVKAKDRFRFKDSLDQKVAAVAKAMGVSLIEAAKIVEGQTTTKHQEAAPGQSQADAETVSTVQARLEELEDLEATASSSLEFETANEHRKEANKLRNKLMDLKIAEVQEKSRSEADAERQFYADYEKSEIKTIALYPQAGVKNSPMAKEMAKFEAEMQELGDPLYHSTDKPFILAQKAAVKLGIPMEKPGTAPAKKPVQHRPMQPAGGNARTSTTDPARRATEVIDGLESMRDYQDLVSAL